MKKITTFECTCIQDVGKEAHNLALWKCLSKQVEKDERNNGKKADMKRNKMHLQMRSNEWNPCVCCVVRAREKHWIRNDFSTSRKEGGCHH